MKEKHGSAILNLERNRHLNKKLAEINERLETQRKLLRASPSRSSSPTGSSPASPSGSTSSTKSPPPSSVSPARSPISLSSKRSSPIEMSSTSRQLGRHQKLKRVSHQISVIQKNPFFNKISNA